LPATPSTIHEYIPTSLTAYGLAEIEERIAQEIAIATDLHVAEESASETPIVVERSAAEQIAVEEVAMDSQAPSVDTTCENTAATDVLTFYGSEQEFVEMQ
jgi:hypothetical protein